MTRDEHKIIGNHPLTRDVRRRIRKIAPTKLHVTLYGEQGTEKDSAAFEIHRKSLRKHDVFIDLDCSQLSLEDEHGSEEQFQNIFNSAWQGTLFLKKADHLPPHRQIQLFNLLTVTKRVYEYSPQKKPQGVRIIADIDNPGLRDSAVFNHHLFSLINQFEIEIAPLRKRKSDIPLLFDYYLRNIVDNLNLGGQSQS